MARNDAVMGVDRGGLADLDVVRLGLGDLQSGLQLVELDHFGHRCSGGDMRAHLQRTEAEAATWPAIPAFTSSAAVCFS